MSWEVGRGEGGQAVAGGRGGLSEPRLLMTVLGMVRSSAEVFTLPGGYSSLGDLLF